MQIGSVPGWEEDGLVLAMSTPLVRIFGIFLNKRLAVIASSDEEGVWILSGEGLDLAERLDEVL